MKLKVRKAYFSQSVMRLIIFIAAMLCYSFVNAQDKTKLLIITGGHDFEEADFFKMFDDMNDVIYQAVSHPKANKLYASNIISDFDVLVFYDMVQEISEEEKVDLIKLLNNGKGIVFLHHALVSYQDWDEFEKIIGGRYVLDEDKKIASTYKHDVIIPVHIEDTSHPVTQGMEDFSIHDEVYGNFKVGSHVQPLLTTTHPESEKVIAWTHQYGNSQIVYLQLGHDYHAYEDPNYLRLLKNAIDFVLHSKKK